MTELHLVETKGELDNYLKFLFEGLDGYVYIARCSRNEKFERTGWTQHFFKYPEDLVKITSFIKVSVEDVYVSPSIYSSQKAEKSDFKSSNVIWTELDDGRTLQIATPGTKDWDIYDCPMPSLRIQSGFPGNEHWYWRLLDPITSAEHLESINRGLAYTFKADQSGWDATQVLRPPDTINFKYSQHPMTKVLYSGYEEHLESSFNKLEPIAPPVEIYANVIPDVLTTVLKYAFSEQAVSLFQSLPGEGTRSTSLMSLGYLCAEMGMSDVEIFSVVRNADDRWGKFKGRTDRNRRLSDLVTRVREKITYPSSHRFQDNSFGFRSFLESNRDLEWILPGLLDKAGYMLLTGPSGVGKTQWSLRWAINLALGKEFLGVPIDKPHKVIFFSLEMGHTSLKFFLQQMAIHLTDEELQTLEENFLVLPLGEAMYLDGKEDQKYFESMVSLHKPEVVFVDSLGSSTAGELSESTVKLIMDFNDKIRQTYSVATWFIHHNRKAQSDNKKPNKMSDVYGGQYIVNRATTVLCLWPYTDKIEIIELKKRLSELGNNWFIRRTDNLNFIRLAEVTLGKLKEELVFKGPDIPTVTRPKYTDLAGGL